MSREKKIRVNAVDLLNKLRKNPLRLPYETRELAHRKRSDMMKAPLSKIRYWLARVNIALERQAANYNWDF